MLDMLPEPWVLGSIGAALGLAAGLVMWFLHSVRLAACLGVAAVVCCTAGLVAHEYEARGADRVQVEWDADKAARIKRTAEITLQLSQRLQLAMDAEIKLKGETDARFKPLESSVAAISPGSRVHLSLDVDRVFHDAARAANAGSAPDSGAKAPAPAVSNAAQSDVAYNGAEFGAWAVKVAEVYADCVNLWKAARVREDELREILGLK